MIMVLFSRCSKILIEMTNEFDRWQAFIEWLNKELDVRGISDRALARLGGISQSSISLIRAGQIPGLKVLRGIARGLDTPLSIVLQEAGIEEPVETPPSLRDLLHIATQLPDEDRKRLLAVARAFREQTKQEKKLGEIKVG